MNDSQLVNIALQHLRVFSKLPGPIVPFLRLFLRHFHNQRYDEAADILALAPDRQLRHPQLMGMFAQLPTAKGKSSSSEYYFGRMLRAPGALYPFESFAVLSSLAEKVPSGPFLEKTQEWISSGKIPRSKTLLEVAQAGNIRLYSLLLPLIEGKEWAEVEPEMLDEYWKEDLFQKYNLDPEKPSDVTPREKEPKEPIVNLSRTASMSNADAEDLLLMSPIFQ